MRTKLISFLVLLVAVAGTEPVSAQITNLVTSSSPAVGPGPVGLVAVDVNGDGKPDLITVNNGNNTLTVLTNNGSGVFGSNVTLRVGALAEGVAAADLNGDGRVDLISANYFGLWPDNLDQ